MLGVIFTYVMTFGGAVASLFNPHLGLLVYIGFSILKPEYLWPWAVPPGSYSRIVALALLFGWLIRGMGHWRFGRAHAIVIALSAYWLWSMVSAFAAPNQTVAWNFVEQLSKIVLPFLVGITVIGSVQELKQVAWVIVGAHGFLAYEFNLSYYQGWNRLLIMGHGGMDEICMSVAFVCSSAFAVFLAMTTKRWWLKTFTIALAVLMIHAVFFSYARTGMVALATTAIVGFFLIPKTLAHYIIFVAVLALGFRLAGTEVRDEFMTVFAEEGQRDWSAQSRVDLAADAWDAMLNNPILGLGPDHFPLVAEQYGWPAGKEVHNLWLQTGAELGFPGVIFLIVFYGICISRLWSIRREDKNVTDVWFHGAARMVIASLVAFSVAALFVTLEGLEVPYYITLIGAGVLKLSSLAQTEVGVATSPSESVVGVRVSNAFQSNLAGRHQPQLENISSR